LHDQPVDLYEKMQYSRCKYDESTIKKQVEDFKKLINSFKLYGFDPEFPIPISQVGIAMNGSHRTACALYFGLENIFVSYNKQDKKYKSSTQRNFSLEWFKDSGFLTEEIAQIAAKQSKILQNFNIKLDRNVVYDLWRRDGASWNLLTMCPEAASPLRATMLYELGDLANAEKCLRSLSEVQLHELPGYLYASILADEIGLSDARISTAAQIGRQLLQNRNNKSLEHFLKEKSIAVVGNSGRELCKTKGCEIDNHNLVVRFSSYPLSEYKQDYGMKADVWATSGSADVLPRFAFDYPFIVLCRNVFNWNVSIELLDAIKAYMDRYPENIVCLDQKISDYPSNGDKFSYPTAGAIFLNHMYRLKILPSIYGFAFLDKNPNDGSHYYDDKAHLDRKDGVHYFEWEINFLSNIFGVK
jgi:hypothetical protein